MAVKAKLAPYLESLSGRICKKTGGTFQLQKHTGNVVLYDYHQGEQPNTADQQAVKDSFAAKASALSVWWSNNKPSDTNTDGTKHYQALKTQYHEQKKVNGIYAYARTLVTKDLKIKIGSSTYELATDKGSNEANGGTTGGTDLNG